MLPVHCGPLVHNSLWLFITLITCTYQMHHYLPIWLLFFDWLDPEDEHMKILCKIGNYSPSDKASHPGHFNLQQQCCENLISCIGITITLHMLYK